ncbi:MAG: alpha/beta hydrolase [Oscillospiraceae bacterium]|nr:alpha/beta hydrolase [Oscillospiraceae bacterium]
MRDAILYIHGQGGSADEAERYERLCPGYHVRGLDYHGTVPWETKGEVLAACDGLFREQRKVVIIANSIGAYYAMNALQERSVSQALFISPIVDMEKLICDMMARSGVTEAELAEKREIRTPFGETLSWEYLRYVREHPVAWTVPTHILYGDRDELTSISTLRAFADSHNADVEIMKGGEHWFHTSEQMAFHDAWVKRLLA